MALLTIHDSILHYHDSTSLYLTLYYLIVALLRSTLLYHGSISLYLTLHYSTMVLLHSRFLYHSCTSLYLSLYYYTINLLLSIQLDSTNLPLVYFTLLDSIPWLFLTICDSVLLYHGSTSLYLTLHYCTMALLHST